MGGGHLCYYDIVIDNRYYIWKEYIYVLFNSYVFIFFFLPLTFAGFFLLGRTEKYSLATAWLVFASFFFYGWWDVRYVPLLGASIVFNYLVGRRLENQPGHKPWLILGIVVNVLLLGYFKYTDFFLSTVNTLAGVDYFDLPHIILPLGISFFTFTQTAYLVDAYRGEARNESFLTYCEFVTIFPHLIAGPIINHKKMIPQFVAKETFHLNYDNIAMGISLFTIGLFKKVIIADMLSPWVKDAFTNADKLTFLEAWIGALAYTFQLYFDFSGYSEMAIGLGLMFNLRLPVNFNSPYQAKSIIDFWRRWHMTLGSWVKDYLYIPMGGNRHGEIKKMRNLFISMLIIGLWHGAGWTFIIWGGLHGLFLMINHQWRRLNIQLPNFVNWGITFLCVVICWVFFRADSISSAFNILAAMTDITGFALPLDSSWERSLSSTSIAFVEWHIHRPFHQCLLVILFLGILLYKVKNPILWMEKFKANWKWFIGTLIVLLYTLYNTNSYTEFLYFQF